MADPIKFTPGFDFSAFQAGAPTTPLPGNSLDDDLADIATSIDEIVEAVKQVRRSDGALQNQIVTPDSLSAGTLTLMGGSWVPRGAWLTATAYAASDVVTTGGITYVCVTAHTSGTFATDLAAGKWVAISGAAAAIIYDNAASGLAAETVQDAIDELDGNIDDAAGDATAALAALGLVKVSANDTTPASLEAKLLVGAAFSLSTQNDGANETRTIDAAFASQAEAEAGTATDKPLNALRVAQAIAAQTSAFVDQVARDNTILNAIDILELQGGSVKALVNMVVDAFEDETGTDTGTSTNEVFDSVRGCYANFADVAISGGTGTVIGEFAGGAGGTGAQAFDGATNEARTGSAEKATSASGYNNTLGKNWGAGKRISKVIVYGANDVAILVSNTTNVKVQGYNGSTWVDVSTALATSGNSAVLTFDTEIFDTSSYNQHRINIEGNGSNTVVVAELVFYELTVTDMVLVSNAITAAAAPEEVRVVIDHEDIDATVTVNTDLVVAVTRDGGSTWTNAVLAEALDAGSGRTVQTADVDVSGQPSGTSVKIRVTTANSKPQRAYARGLQADVALTV